MRYVRENFRWRIIYINYFTNGKLFFYEYMHMYTDIECQQREILMKGWRDIFWGDRKLRRNNILQVKRGNGSGDKNGRA